MRMPKLESETLLHEPEALFSHDVLNSNGT